MGINLQSLTCGQSLPKPNLTESTLFHSIYFRWIFWSLSSSRLSKLDLNLPWWVLMEIHCVKAEQIYCVKKVEPALTTTWLNQLFSPQSLLAICPRGFPFLIPLRRNCNKGKFNHCLKRWEKFFRFCFVIDFLQNLLKRGGMKTGKWKINPEAFERSTKGFETWRLIHVNGNWFKYQITNSGGIDELNGIFKSNIDNLLNFDSFIRSFLLNRRSKAWKVPNDSKSLLLTIHIKYSFYSDLITCAA